METSQRSSLLDHPDINPRILTPSPPDPSAAILGPTLTAAPSGAFRDFLPFPRQHHNHHPFLLTSTSVDCSIFLKEARFIRSWPYLDDPFRLWAHRVLSAKEDVLRRQRIYSLIQLSLNPITCDTPLLGAASLFWCVGYNVFYFPCGPMSVTVRDVEAICGTHACGEEIDGLLHPSSRMPKYVFGHKSCRNYASFLEANRRLEGEVTDEEFVAFLLYWLCKYLLCVSAQHIVVEHLMLAVCLTEERVLNLSGYLLANLYRGMYSLISCLVDGRIGDVGIACGGPLWLLQLWLHLYFPVFGYDKVLPKELRGLKGCYWEELIKIRPLSMCFQECYNVFSGYTRRDDDFFVLSKESERKFHGEDRGKLLEYYGNVLIPRDLQRAVNWKGVNSAYGVEVYSPHFCARQFGLRQSIPVPLFYSANTGFVVRVTFKDVKSINGVKFVNRELADRFGKEFLLFSSKPCTMPLFDDWWRTVVRDTLHPKEGSKISMILVPNPEVYVIRSMQNHQVDGQVEARRGRRRKKANDKAEGSASSPRAPVIQAKDPVAHSCLYQPTQAVTAILSDEEISLERSKHYKISKSVELTSDMVDEPSIKECNKKLDEIRSLRMDDPLYVAACIIFCESKSYREQWMLLSMKPEEVRLAWLRMLAKKLGFI